MSPEKTGRIGCSVFKTYFKANQKKRRQIATIITKKKRVFAFFIKQCFGSLKGIFHIILIFLI